MSKSIAGLILAGGIFLFTIIGVLFNYFFDKKQLNKVVNYIFTVLFLMVIFISVFFLFPEIYNCLGFKHLYLFLIFLVLGFIIIKIIDNYLPGHDNNKLIKKELPSNYKHIGILVIIALAVYNVVVGMDLYNTILVTTSEAISLTISMAIRNMVFGFIIYYLVNKKDEKLFTKILLVGVLSISIVVGVLIMMIINSKLSAIFMGCSISLVIGMFIYILINELLLKIRKPKNKNELVWGIVTALLIVIISMLV